MSGKLNQLSNLFKLSPEADQKSLEFMMMALEKNNQEGFDYIEFKQAFNALLLLPLDEVMSVKSAFTTGNTLGLTKESLLRSADFYKQVIHKEKVQFDAALKNQREQKIDGRKAEQQKLQDQISRNKDLINKLQAEIDQYQKSIDGVDEEIEAAIAKIEDSRYKFEHTFSEIITQLSKDIELINQNI
ncbi:MAG TPA: hypothetical protein PLC76_10920 [Saprospiraceae bacterium]|nr:MAG: hypothetical protein UZ08_BCD001000223 [Candidatus Parvibacillus calidus]MCC7150172.1 hypothetical protein [Saprospiraceae bacterium]HRN34790.1 hypothetical protein [Saprospiraceae bacterium]HRP85224.1 hypothetical protein [Saprospiraceae bacterium]